MHATGKGVHRGIDNVISQRHTMSHLVIMTHFIINIIIHSSYMLLNNLVVFSL